jgi:hypothetical protein
MVEKIFPVRGLMMTAMMTIINLVKRAGPKLSFCFLVRTVNFAHFTQFWLYVLSFCSVFSFSFFFSVLHAKYFNQLLCKMHKTCPSCLFKIKKKKTYPRWICMMICSPRFGPSNFCFSNLILKNWFNLMRACMIFLQFSFYCHVVYKKRNTLL